MNIDLSSTYLQSLLGTSSTNTSSASGSTGSNTSSIDASSFSMPQDTNQLSPFAQMLSTLQQLQSTDPAKYQQVTGQIAANLQSAAKTASADGNTKEASQLNQLATDFTNASQSGQLPSIQDLAQAAGAGHHHHGHHHSHSGSSTSTPDASQNVSTYQASASQNNAFDPMAVISSTLSNAGLTS